MFRFLGRLTAFLGQHAAIIRNTFQQSLLETFPARLRAGWPVPQLPLLAGHVSAGTDITGLQLPGTVGSWPPPGVPTLHRPPLPARAAWLGALAPLLDDPLRRDDLLDGIEGLFLFTGHLLWPRLSRLLHEIGELDLGLRQVPHREDLDGQRLLQRAETADPLQRGRGAAVSQHAALVGDVLLQRWQGVVTVEDVGAIHGFDGQEAAVMSGTPVISLLHLNVRCPSWNGDDIVVARSVQEKRERLSPLLVPGKGKKLPGTRLNFIWSWSMKLTSCWPIQAKGLRDLQRHIPRYCYGRGMPACQRLPSTGIALWIIISQLSLTDQISVPRINRDSISLTWKPKAYTHKTFTRTESSCSHALTLLSQVCQTLSCTWIHCHRRCRICQTSCWILSYGHSQPLHTVPGRTQRWSRGYMGYHPQP